MNLCDKKSCTGCASCFNSCPKSAIEMKMDYEGFLYPVINNNICIDCGICIKACPELSPVSFHSKVQQPIAALCKDVDIRMKSSSGGLFTIFSNYIFENSGVVFGASLDEHFNVIYTIARQKEELSTLRCS